MRPASSGLLLAASLIFYGWHIPIYLLVLVVVGALAIGVRLRRRQAPARAYALGAAAILGYALALGWLHAIRLERVHLPEYGIASLLAWWALVPSLGDRGRTYVAAAALAALTGVVITITESACGGSSSS